MNKKTVKTKLLLTILAVVLVLPILAYGQTPFVLQNLGQYVNSDDARMAGRGYWGMAVADTLHPGFKNVASLTALKYMAMELNAYGEQVSSSNDQDSRLTSRAYVPDFRIAAPVIKGRLALTAGFKIDRSFQYKTSRDRTWYAWNDTLYGNVEFVRTGSIFEVPLGLAYEVLPHLSIAGTLSRVHGSVTEEQMNDFGPVLYRPNLRVQKDSISGTKWTMSGLWTGIDGINIGGSFTPEYTLSIDRKVEEVGVGNRINSSLEYSMPLSWSVGAQVYVADRWLVGGDYQFAEYSKFSGQDAWVADMEDEYSLGIGVERTRASVRRGGLDNLPIRVGYSMRHWAYRVGGNPVEENTVSIGTGFPFRGNMGQLDLAFSYSRIGDVQDNGYKSDVYRFSVSVTGLERWW